MRTLNDIPDYLRGPEKKEWTPGRGLLRGTIYSLIVAAMLGAILCAVTYYVPQLTCHWLLNMASGFLVTWVLFVVMYRAAGMASKTGALVVILWTLLILVAKYLALLMHLLNTAPGTGMLWSSFNVVEMAGVSFPAWIGVLVGAFMCKDGDSTLHELADLLMTNPLTGRRI